MAERAAALANEFVEKGPGTKAARSGFELRIFDVSFGGRPMANRTPATTSQQVRGAGQISLDVVAFTVITTVSIVMLMYYVGYIGSM
jgi:hypothetical protein